MNIETSSVNDRARAPKVAGNRHFYACIGSLMIWIALVGFILYPLQSGDGSQTLLWSTVGGVMIVTTGAFAAAFWALCSVWLLPGKSLQEVSENV